jgi:mannonate dehydratase
VLPPRFTALGRRRFLAAGGALGAALLTTGASRWWPEQGFVNPCLAPTPMPRADHELIQAAWDGLDPAQCWDVHVHLAGIGDSDSGIVLNPKMTSLLHPLLYSQRLFYLNAGCARTAPGTVDAGYVTRLQALMQGMPSGFKLLLFPFDCHVREDGSVSWEQSSFYVPDRYAADVVYGATRYFEWAASIHPYRGDAEARLEAAIRAGARAVKWLPAAMGIDPASPRCDGFYETLARHDVPLITHAGVERAVESSAEELGNPLRLRRALEHGVRVVIAHCASLGSDIDLDRGPSGPVADSFALFERLMDEPRWQGRVFGDVSAVTQINRVGPALARLLERDDWHARLLNGSDYPLPGVMPLYSADYLVEQGFLEREAAPVLKEIRARNALLFDFVLKRSLRWKGKRFADSVFETRRFFDRGATKEKAKR